MQCAALSSLNLWTGPIRFSDTYFFLSSGRTASSLYVISSDLKKTPAQPTDQTALPSPAFALSLIVIVLHFSGALIENLLLSSI